MADAKGLITVPKTAYEMQQHQIRKLAERNAQLEKGLPTAPSEAEAENRALRARAAALEAELAALRAAKSAAPVEKSRLSITEKGCISIKIGTGWPVFLYPGQLEKILDMADDLRAFIAEHDAELK